MIEIKELRALRGPNRHTRHTAIFMVLDIKAYENLPSGKIDGFSDRLLTLMPTLQEHGCSTGKPGGVYHVSVKNDGCQTCHSLSA